MVSQPGLLKAVKELKSITSSGRKNRQTLRRSNTCVSTLQPSTTVYSATAVRLQTWQSSGDSAVFRRIDVSPRAVQCSTSSFSHLWRLEHPHRWQRQRVCHETQWTIADIRPRPTHPRANTCSRPHSRHIVISRSDTVVQQLSVGDFVSAWSRSRQLKSELATVCINTSTCHTEKLAKLHRSRLWGRSGSIQTLCWSAQFSGSVSNQ